MDIERINNRTEVIVDEGINTVSYALDEQLIEALTLIQVSSFFIVKGFCEQQGTPWQLIEALTLIQVSDMSVVAR